MSNLSCGTIPNKQLVESNRLYIDSLGPERDFDLDRDPNMKQLYIFPLTNETGWFSYNSYMYALSRGLHIVGFPSGISTYDGNYGCPVPFMVHDLGHVDAMLTMIFYNKKMPNSILPPFEFEKGIKFYEIPGTDELACYYDTIMRGNYTRHMKEILIFTLWAIIHESFVTSLDFANLDLKNTHVRFIPGESYQYSFFGIRLTDDELNEAFEMAASLLSEYDFEQIWSMKATLEGKYLGVNWYKKLKQLEAEGVSSEESRRLLDVKNPTETDEDHYHANLAVIYGIDFFMKYFIFL